MENELVTAIEKAIKDNTGPVDVIAVRIRLVFSPIDPFRTGNIIIQLLINQKLLFLIFHIT